MACHRVLIVVMLFGTTISAELTIRVRPVEVQPRQGVRIHWRWGGEGLGGTVTRGELTAVAPAEPTVSVATPIDDPLADLDLDLSDGPKDREIMKGKVYDHHYLYPGTWSPNVPVSSFRRQGKRSFITFTFQAHTRTIQHAKAEFDFQFKGKSIKRFIVEGPDGPTFGIFLPPLSTSTPSESFVAELGSLHDYANRRIDQLNANPWISEATPQRYAIVTDCAGYGIGSGYGVRTTDRKTMLAEFEVLRLMGVNGTRGCPQFILDMIEDGRGIGPGLSRARLVHTTGYPINMVKYADGKPPRRSPGDGCPYHPINVSQIDDRVKVAVDELVRTAKTLPVDEVWALTVDEIGSVFDGAPERKSHQGSCPHCRQAFRALVEREGLSLSDFGAKTWDAIRSTYGYWSINYWDAHGQLNDARAAARKALDKASKAQLSDSLSPNPDPLDLDDGLLGDLDGTPKPKSISQLTSELKKVESQLEQLEWTSKFDRTHAGDRSRLVSDAGWDRLTYYSRRFNADSSAILFQKLQQAIASANANKSDASQASIYSYALRGNTFLMGGHSLDFFDFYRFADNAFVYETSNRDYRVWHWDSYLCDVGRTLNRAMNKRFGVYVKPHRGAAVQRTLTSVARGARLIYWYTYGPDWSKGDTFAGKPVILNKLAHTSRLIAKAEHVTYDSDWAVPAEVAIVRPLTSKFFGDAASWENGKWMYSALTHAHIPLDAVDETLLMESDLSKYKAIVVAGSHIRRDVAIRLAQWVKNGGTLLTTGGGMRFDEASQPLDDVLLPVFGVTDRSDLELQADVARYGATSLKSIARKANAATTQVRAFDHVTDVIVGRETVRLQSGTDMIGTYSDGRPAMTRNTFGKGNAWLIAHHAGVEYATDVMGGGKHQASKRDSIAMPIIQAGVRPVVDASEPLVEGVLLASNRSKEHAVVLMNWTRENLSDVTIKLRGAATTKRITSTALNSDVAFTRDGDVLTLELTTLGDGDILLLEP